MRNLLSSVRASFALILLLTATLLLLARGITGDQWLELAKMLGTTLLLGHTVSHAVDTISKRPTNLPSARVVESDTRVVESDTEK